MQSRFVPTQPHPFPPSSRAWQGHSLRPAAFAGLSPRAVDTNFAVFSLLFFFTISIAFATLHIGMHMWILRAVVYPYYLVSGIFVIQQLMQQQNRLMLPFFIIAGYSAVLFLNSWLQGQIRIELRELFWSGVYFTLPLIGFVLAVHNRRVSAKLLQSYYVWAVGGLMCLVAANLFVFMRRHMIGMGFRGFDVEGANPINMGVASAVAALVMLAFALRWREPIGRILCGAASLGFALCLVLTSSRGAMLFFGVTVTFMMAHFLRSSAKSPSEYLLRLFGTAVIGGGLLTFAAVLRPRLFLAQWELFRERLLPTWEFLIGKHYASERVAGSGRIEIWRTFWEMAPEWWVNGLAGYRPRDVEVYPHNLFLEAGVIFGLLSIPLIAVLLFTFVFAVWKLLGKRPLGCIELAMVGMLLFSLLQSMTSMGFFMHRALYPAMGFVFGMWYLERGMRQEHKIPLSVHQDASRPLVRRTRMPQP